MFGQGFATDWFKQKPIGSQYDKNTLPSVLQGLKDHGYTNLRLRSRGDLWGFPDSASGQAATSMNTKTMNDFLTEILQVSVLALQYDIIPIISWVHDGAEGRGNEQDGRNFEAWWRAVADKFKDADERITFNLMTELGQQGGTGRLYDNINVYNSWTWAALSTIRSTGSKNSSRIIIVTAPRNGKPETLKQIVGNKGDGEWEDFWADDYVKGKTYFELHDYAAGPNKLGRSWTGTGSADEKLMVTAMMDEMVKFRDLTGAGAYYGAWMPFDNKDASISDAEAKAFAEFFIVEAKSRQIAWSVNELDVYMDQTTGTWLETQKIGQNQSQMFRVGDARKAWEDASCCE